MQARYLILRHGETAGNAKRKYIGRTDEPLSSAGAAAVQPLEKLPVLVVVSPMRRCIQTAALLLGAGPDEDLFRAAGRLGIPVRVEQDLRECDFGAFENMNHEELEKDPYYQRWIDSGASLPFPGGESREGFEARCVRAFGAVLADTFSKYKMKQEPEPCTEQGPEQRAADSEEPYILVVVHGGTIMSVMSSLADDRNGRRKEYYDWYVPNGHGFLVQTEDGKGLRVLQEV